MNIEQHRARPEISIDRHVKRRVVELGRSLDAKASIYLDTKFWVLLRKAALGLDTGASIQELLRVLRAGVADNKLFCPISESVFLELLKQSDASSRAATARLIDELSLGVTLLHNQARFATEVAHFLHGFDKGADALHPIRHLVWSKLSYVLGFLHPTSTPFDADTELSIQKSFFDHMWTIPLATMIEMIGEVPDPAGLYLNDIAVMLNDGNARHAGDIRSFDQVRKDELRGVADLCAGMAADVLCDMAEKRGIQPAARESASWNQSRSMCANLLFHALTSKPQTRLQLPSPYIEACLHAAVRWDKTRRIKGNDLYDFNHASAALGYCNAFFTEHPLRVLIESKNIGLDELYPCRMVSDVEEAAAYVTLLLHKQNVRSSMAREGM